MELQAVLLMGKWPFLDTLSTTSFACFWELEAFVMDAECWIEVFWNLLAVNASESNLYDFIPEGNRLLEYACCEPFINLTS